jgi:hypothetical protein
MLSHWLPAVTHTCAACELVMTDEVCAALALLVCGAVATTWQKKRETHDGAKMKRTSSSKKQKCV